MQESRTENKKAMQDLSVMGVLCFALGGFILFAWTTFAIREILEALIIIGFFASVSGLVGALAFALIGIGIKLIVR